MASSRSYHILVTAAGIPKPAIEFLKAKNCTIDQWHLETVIPTDEVIRRIKDVDAVYCTLNDQIGKDVIAAASSKLKVIATMSVGTDHVDKAALKERGIRFGYTPDVVTNASAELITCLILSTMRKTFQGALAVKNGEWPDGWRPLWMCGSTIHGSTLGFVGFGRIGQALAARLKAFGPAKMLYSCRTRKENLEPELGITWRQNLDELLVESDVVIVCCALDDTTRYLMNKDKLSLIKPGRYFVNASRGAVVDQDALIELLRQGHFAGVGLDVTTPEPLPATSELLAFPECTVFPHMASSCVKTRERMADLVVNNIWAALQGKEMPAEWK